MPPRIVVVDDDPDIREVLGEFLRTLGYEVTTVASAGEAVDRYSKHGFEIVLVDLALPGVDGLQLVHQLRALSEDLGILVYSGRHNLRQAAFDAGCDRFVLKPAVDKLERALEEWPWPRADEAGVKVGK